ncbi:MAG TPA: mannose-6-phosphate isomerase, class I, partial [Polyangiaceae bacterium]
RLATGARSLAELLRESPEAQLGARVADEFGRDLPFLLKLLAAEEPLSLQAHPNLAQARAGFERENQARVPLDARERSYRDRNHKPELIAALTPFHALVGFRSAQATTRLFGELAVPELAPFGAALAVVPEEQALRGFFELLTSTKGERGRLLAEATCAACRGKAEAGLEFSKEYAWGARIGDLYPGDPSLVLALALNLVLLEPGQAIYLPAGNLHAYLEGAGVEIMASSDNVLRGGLTPKHVDVPELLRVLDFRAGPAVLAPARRRGHETEYLTPAREFALSRLELAGQTAAIPAPAGPEVLVVTAGLLEVRRGDETVSLRGAESAFVPVEGGGYSLSGTGTAFRARVNIPAPSS